MVAPIALPRMLVALELGRAGEGALHGDGAGIDHRGLDDLLERESGAWLPRDHEQLVDDLDVFLAGVEPASPRP
jgi:hypothetical protein